MDRWWEQGDTGDGASDLTRKIHGLEKQLYGLLTRAAELKQKQTGLESLQDRLNQVDELSTRTGAQFDALQKSRADLETCQQETDALHTSRDAVTKSAEQIETQRTVFERFVTRVDDFQQRLPELKSKMDAITATAAVVAAQTQMVAAGTQQVVTLVAMADDLNLQVTRIEGHRQAVESIEARLNALKTLSDTVDRKLKEQLGGRADVDGKLREGLSSRIAATDR